MSLDVLAAIDITALAVLLPGAVILGSGLAARARSILALIAGGWLLLLVVLAAAGMFTTAGGGPAAIGIAFAAPLLAGFLWRRSPAVRGLAAGAPLPLLVVLHFGRLLGVQFLLLHALGRLPAAFAYIAGLGDMLVALESVHVALAVRRQAQGWRGLTLAWNTVGVIDLLTAVTLGVGSAAGSPLRFIHQVPDSGVMGTLPWFLIPGFLVPFYLIVHGFIFARLRARTSENAQGLPHPA